MPIVLDFTFIEYLITTLEIKVQIILRIGKEHDLFTTAFTYIILLIFNEFGAKTYSLHGRIYG